MKLKENFNPVNRAAAGAIRYRLLRTAQSILAVAGVEWKDQHRTCWCSRSLRRGDFGEGGGGFVGVFRNENRDGASLTGLNRCGNLHTCPVCAAKVGELRRKQLSAGMVQHVKNGGAAYLLTLTFPHEADMALAESMAKFDKARQRFQNSRQWKSFKKSGAVLGVVNSLEFTVSQENGWHPHIHALIFCKRKAFGEDVPVNVHGDLTSYQIEDLQHLWCNILFKVGLGDNSKLQDMLKHALNVRGGEMAAEYIAKFGRDERWGASSELARSHAKIGTAGERWGTLHFTPFQLLVWAEGGDGWAVHRFREYAEAVEGKRALTWSRGLKNALGVEDIDEEAWSANDDAPMAEQIQVGEITAEQFAEIMSRKQLPQFLEYVATCADNQQDLDDFIASLVELPRVASGALLIKRKTGREVRYS